jgi:hypothetical protein
MTVHEIDSSAPPGMPAPAVVASGIVCPLCHTPGPSADWWHCKRCSASWTTERLADVAAYGRYARAREAAGTSRQQPK